MNKGLLILTGWLFVGFVHAQTGAVSGKPGSGGGVDFNRDIRPILSENCFYCHGQDGTKRKAGLRLDQRASAIEAGAIVPKEPAASELLKRIHSSDPKTLMPPAKSNRRLTAEQKRLLDQWVRDGAPYAQHW